MVQSKRVRRAEDESLGKRFRRQFPPANGGAVEADVRVGRKTVADDVVGQRQATRSRRSTVGR